MESLRHDVRQAFRMMVAQKAFTATTLLTLALGIGATTAMFSVVYGVLLRPLPYAEPDRLVRIYEVHPGGRPAPFGRTKMTGATIATAPVPGRSVNSSG